MTKIQSVRCPVIQIFKKYTIPALILIAAVILLGFFNSLFLNFSYFTAWMCSAGSISTFTATVLETVMEIVCIFSLLLCCLLVLRIPCIKLLWTGVISCILGLSLMSFFPSLPGFVIGYVILFGFGSGIVNYSVLYAIISPLVGPRLSGVASGLLVCCGSGVSLFIFPSEFNPLGISPEMNFLFAAGIGLFLLVPLIFISRWRKRYDMTSADTGNKYPGSIIIFSHIKALFLNKWFYLLCALFWVSGSYINSLYSFLLDFLTTYHDTTVAENFSILAEIDLCLVAGSIFFGLFMPRVKGKMLLTGIVLFIVALFIPFNLLPISSILLYVFLLISAFVISALNSSLPLYVQENTSPVIFISVINLLMVFSLIGSTMNTFLVGFWQELTGGLMVPNLIKALILIIIGIFAFLLGRKELHRKKALAASASDPEKLAAPEKD